MELDAELGVEREPGQLLRHPLGGTLRVRKEPPRAAFYAGVEQLWPKLLSFQIENAG